MNSYHPSSWVILNVSTPTESRFKILAGWYGGYTGGDSWKLSSDIVSFSNRGDMAEIITTTGSVYVCAKVNERMSGYTASMYASWKKQLEEAQAENRMEPQQFEPIKFEQWVKMT